MRNGNQIMNNKMQYTEVYHSDVIRAWEKYWFSKNNSAYGLMQQAAWLAFSKLVSIFEQQEFNLPTIRIWCGVGNNAGDGYLVAKYLKQAGYLVDVYAPSQPFTEDAQKAYEEAKLADVSVLSTYPKTVATVHIDALLGIGLDRILSSDMHEIISAFNHADGFKVALDLPSGLHPNQGIPMPIAVYADVTLCFIALKLGLMIGQAQNYVGEIYQIPLIPREQQFKATARVQYTVTELPKRLAHQHKGDFGHVLIIGGHPNMGGAAIMAAEAAMSTGAAKVTVLCAEQHHQAILSRSPNIMVKSIEHTDAHILREIFDQIDVVCFGMGLGRDHWARQNYQMVMEVLLATQIQHVILDADALWFLAEHAQEAKLNHGTILTPHAAEAARLLGISVQEIDHDRISAIQRLYDCYGGQWVLKGAGSLSLDQHQQIHICPFGNPGMATGGMGDVLAGMIGGLKAQYGQQINLFNIVTLHAKAGDLLAEQGQKGIQAHHMSHAIYRLINAQSED